MLLAVILVIVVGTIRLIGANAELATLKSGFIRCALVVPSSSTRS